MVGREVGAPIQTALGEVDGGLPVDLCRQASATPELAAIKGGGHGLDREAVGE